MERTMEHADRRRGVGIGLLACALLAMVGCHRTPAEQAIRETIAAMQKAGEQHDIGAVVAPLADDFVGQGDGEGETLDRKSFQRYLTFVQLREGGTIHSTIGPITVALQGTDRATADFTLLVTGGAGLLPADGQMEQVRTGWRLNGSKWQMISAEWKASGAGK
jgi:hypothetical protein